MKKIAKAYYGSRISPNQTKTPEGYLILHNVPIARTGEQEYLGSEIGVDVDRVMVNRTEEQVFSPATIASFEGKPVTNNHPTQEVTPDNVSSYLKGVSTNVRHGTGDEADLLLGDLIIYDPILLSAIENGKKEISCGYDCVYVQVGDGYEQQQIRGNHVAVVDNGRAGNRVAIKDSKLEERGKKMIFSLDRIFGLGMKEFAKDATPEELAEAMKAKKEEKEPVKDAEPDVILATLQAIVTRLEALESKEQAQQDTEPEPDAMDALEKELEGTKDSEESNEESNTVEPEKINDEEPEPEKENTKDSNEMLKYVRAMKPVIAGMSNPAEKKLAVDALTKVVRDSMPKPAKQQTNSYQALLKAKQIKDSAVEPADQTLFGQNCASRNPHTKQKQGGK